MATLQEMQEAADYGMKAGQGKVLRYITAVEVEAEAVGLFLAFFRTGMGRIRVPGSARTPQEMTSNVIKAWLEE